jgi:DNA-3-methyladenine glycosylase II
VNQTSFEQLRSDPQLGSVVASHGPVTVEPAADPFARFVIAILNQQLSTESATAIQNRLFAAVEVSPDSILAAKEATLRDTGLSRQKIQYIRNIADAHQAGKISPERYAEFTDDEVIADLTEIKGVGGWTARIFLMFILGREDVFPVGDLAIRKAMAALFGMETTNRTAMIKTATRWMPYRTYASIYLWKSID